MKNDAGPRRREDVLIESLPDGSAVLFDPRNEMTYPITASAALVWHACDGARTAASMVEALAERYEALPDVIDRDVQQLLRHLSELSLLAPVQGASA